jgi:hypothetical protein
MPGHQCPSGPGDRVQTSKLLNVVPVERIELPTFGLQNRCSTAELNRPLEGDQEAAESGWRAADLSAGRISDLAAKGQQANGLFGLKTQP